MNGSYLPTLSGGLCWHNSCKAVLTELKNTMYAKPSPLFKQLTKYAALATTFHVASGLHSPASAFRQSTTFITSAPAKHLQNAPAQSAAPARRNGALELMRFKALRLPGKTPTQPQRMSQNATKACCGRKSTGSSIRHPDHALRAPAANSYENRCGRSSNAG